MEDLTRMREIRQICWIGMILALLIGCTLMGHWVKLDGTTEQYKIDIYTCEKEATLIDARGLYHINGVRYKQCMESKGYEWIED
jgi:hypothetical protein